MQEVQLHTENTVTINRYVNYEILPAHTATSLVLHSTWHCITIPHSVDPMSATELECHSNSSESFVLLCNTLHIAMEKYWYLLLNMYYYAHSIGLATWGRNETQHVIHWTAEKIICSFSSWVIFSLDFAIFGIAGLTMFVTSPGHTQNKHK
jgi:hypothetical protein